MSNKKIDKAMGELLTLLKTHPQLVHSLVFNPKEVKRLLKSAAAKKLVRGVDMKTLLERVAGPEAGFPHAQCRRGTALLCPKATRPALCAGGSKLCGGGTKLCAGGTKLCAGGTKLCAGGTKLCAGGTKLCAGGTKLCAGGTKLCSGGTKL